MKANLAEKELRPTCQHPEPTRKGTLCAVPILTPGSVARGEPRCWAHDPDVSPEVKQAAFLKGGAVNARTVRQPDAVDPALRTMDQIQAYIEETGGRLDRGEITERGSNARMQVADKAIRAHEANLGARLDELEALVAKRARAVPASTRVRVIR